MTPVDTLFEQTTRNAGDFCCGLALTWHILCAVNDEAESQTFGPMSISTEQGRDIAESVIEDRRSRNVMFLTVAAMYEMTYGISA